MTPVTESKAVFKGANITALLFSFFASATVWLWPVPAGVEQKSWQLFAIFVFLIVGIISKALSMGGMSFLALTFLIVSKTLTVKEAFSGFSQSIIWLVVAAFLLSRAFIKTGLGMRFAYFFVFLLGKNTLGLGYGMTLSELVLAPAIPSNTARAGGVLFPIIRSLSASFDSTPEKHSQRLIGSFLILNGYYSNLITSAMFATAMAANPLILSVFNENGFPLSWGAWAIAALVPGVISLTLVPLLVYKLYPPELKYSPEAKNFALRHLKQMGPMKWHEWLTLGVFFLLMLLWAFGERLFGLDAAAVALLGVSIFIVTGVLTWNDIKQEHEAWDTLIWFSTLVMIAAHLNSFGMIKWFSSLIHAQISHMEWFFAWPALTAIYFYSHYLFAGNTAHVTSMFAAFFQVGLSLGIAPYLIGLSLAFSSSLFACLTHYGTGCAPILFGSEYVNLKTWWRMGALMSFVFLLIWVGIGSLWWKILGLW